MIGFLRGRLAHRQPPHLVIDVGGVGYELQAPMSTFYGLPQTGAELTLVTHLVVREDAQELYGFASEAERALFRNLIKVSGVGARLALAVLSGMSVDSFVACVQAEDSASLIKLPGVGKKTAERLIIEMRDKIDAVAAEAPAQAAGAAAPSIIGEAIEALQALGYKPADAEKMIRQAQQEEAADSASQLIRRALQSTVRA